MDCVLFTDGVEKGGPLNSNYVSVFIEKDAREIEELIRGTKGSLDDCQSGGRGVAFGDLPWDSSPQTWPI